MLLRCGKRLLRTLCNLLQQMLKTSRDLPSHLGQLTVLPHPAITFSDTAAGASNVQGPQFQAFSSAIPCPNSNHLHFPQILPSASKSVLFPHSQLSFICSDSTAFSKVYVSFFSLKKKKKNERKKLQLFRVPQRRRQTDVSSYSPRIHDDQCMSSILLCPSCDCLIRC